MQGAPVRRRARDDTGAYLILYALLAVALFTLAAIVLDLAGQRQARQADHATADLAATAGAAIVDATDPTTAAAACQAAWGYAVANRSVSGALSAPDCTGTFPSTDVCNPGVARTATGAIGPLTVEITNPVPDSSNLMDAEVEGGDQAQSVVGTFDGSPCERVAVHIFGERPYLLGVVSGINSGRTNVHSVARAKVSSSAVDVPAIVSLNPSGCDGVTTGSAGGILHAGGSQPGVIVVDSDASGCAGGYTISPGNPGGIIAEPDGTGTPGAIFSFALSGSGFARSYNPADTGSGRLSPVPIPLVQRTTRGFIDHRYNCTTADCPAGSDHINQLRAALQTGTPPVGYVTYSGPCLVPSGTPVLLAGNTFVDCPVFEVAGSVTFAGSGVVFSGGVQVDDSGCLAVNDTTCGAAGIPLLDSTVYLRSGSITKTAKGQLVLRQAFVYLPGSISVGEDGTFSGSSELYWTSPLGGPFEDLLAWTEGAGGNLIGQQATTVFEGTVFTPNATTSFEARPGGGITLTAQAVADRVALQGSRDVTLDPSPARATGRTTRQVRLIR